MTNGAKIRSMTDEEIVDIFDVDTVCTGCPAQDACATDGKHICRLFLLRWLKREAKDD